jgi:hypothetical protein
VMSKMVERGGVEECGGLSVHDHIDVAWFCVCASWVVRRWEMNVRFAVVVGESASALGDRRVCMEGV